MKATEVRAGLLFPHAVQALQITRRRQPLADGPAETEVIYLVTSLPTHQASPTRLAPRCPCDAPGRARGRPRRRAADRPGERLDLRSGTALPRLPPPAMRPAVHEVGPAKALPWWTVIIATRTACGGRGGPAAGLAEALDDRDGPARGIVRHREDLGDTPAPM
ncbi:hypothetical protein MXD63_19130 [Frankia sp. Cpl3]|nr:hypothetical protein [Frankia sp. Cpl3]